MRSGRPGRRKRYLEQAAGLADEPAERGDLLERAGWHANHDSDYDAAERLLTAAIADYESIGDTRAAIRAGSRLCNVEWTVGRQEEALARGEQLLEIASTREPDAALAGLASAMGNAYFFAGNHDRADELLSLALDLGESLRVPEAISRAFAGKGMRAMAQDHPEEALAYTKHGLTIALDNEDWERAYNLYFNLSDLEFQRDRYEEALAYLEAALAIVRRRGSRPGEWSVLAESTYPLYMLGRWEEALVTAAEVPEEKLSAALTMSLLASVLEIRAHRGDPVEARRLLSLFGHLADATDVQDRSGYLAATAAVLRAEGRLADALTAGVEAAELSRELFNMSTQTVKQGLVEAIEAALGLGETARAAELVGTIEAIPPGLQPPYLTAQASRFRALLAGTGESAESGFRVAATGFAEIGVVFWQAVTLLQHGEWLVARGRPDEAAPLLAEARETFERLEVTPWLDRLELAESDAEGRPRREPEACGYRLGGNERLDPDRRGSLGEAGVGDDHHVAVVEDRLRRGEVDRVVAAEGALVGKLAGAGRQAAR